MPAATPEVLIAENARFARRLAWSLLHDDADADDATQDALAAAVRHGPGGAAAPRSWIARVVRNAAARLRRSTGRRARRETVAAARGARVAPDAPASAERAEVLAALAAALARLSEPMRTAVMLRHFDGLPPRAIAARLGVPVETVKSRLARALDELRTDLGADPRSRGDARRAYAVLLAVPAPTPGASTGEASPAAAPRGVSALAIGTAAAVAIGAAAIAWRVGESHDDGAAALPTTVAATADAAPAPAPPVPLAARPPPPLAAPPATARASSPAHVDAEVPASETPAQPALGDGASDRAMRAAALPVEHPAVAVAVFVDGRPAARQALRLENFDAALDARLSRRTLALDADGTGRFDDLPAGTYRLWLEGPGPVRRWWPFRHAPGPASETRRRLVFAVGSASIEGRVFGRDGRPAVGCEVGIRIERDGVTDVLVETEADADGRYRLDRLPPGRGVLFAQVGGKENGADEHLRTLDVVDGTSQTIDLGSAQADPLWTGTVVWSSGTPVRGPGVLHGGWDAARGGQIVVRFDARGAFAQRVAVGPHRFRVELEPRPAADGDPARGEVQLGRLPAEVTATGGPARFVVPGVVVRGRVMRRAAGAPVPEGVDPAEPLRVTIAPRPGEPAAPSEAPLPVARVGAAGDFALEGVPPGRWRVVGTSATLVGEDGRPYVLDVLPTRDVEGVVLVEP